jgi:hypothetical protein
MCFWSLLLSFSLFFQSTTALQTLKARFTAALLDSGVFNFTNTFLIVGVSIKESKLLVVIIDNFFDQ